MLKIELILISVVFLLVSCNEEPELRVGKSIVFDAKQVQDIVEKYSASPMKELKGQVRVKQLSRNCRQCHDGQNILDYPETQSHWDIQLKHDSDMVCADCHDRRLPDLFQGRPEPLTLTEIPLLCGGCHSTQFKDWKGGSHGKRLSGWAQPRVIETCTQCHNPHRPHFQAEATVAHPTIIPSRLLERSHE